MILVTCSTGNISSALIEELAALYPRGTPSPHKRTTLRTCGERNRRCPAPPVNDEKPSVINAIPSSRSDPSRGESRDSSSRPYNKTLLPSCVGVNAFGGPKKVRRN